MDTLTRTFISFILKYESPREKTSVLWVFDEVRNRLACTASGARNTFKPVNLDIETRDIVLNKQRSTKPEQTTKTLVRLCLCTDLLLD